MKSVILAAGFGTRLHPLTHNTPKALLDIKGKPLIDRIIEKIPDSIRDVYVITNTKFYVNFSEWLNESHYKKKVIAIVNNGVSRNEDRLGGIGDLCHTIKKADIKDDILLILGDNYFDFKLDEFVHRFREKKEILIGSYEVEREKANRFGVINTKDNYLLEFEEKPKHPQSSRISIGIYAFPKSKLQAIDEYSNNGMNKEGVGYMFPYLLKKDNIIRTYDLKGKWYDIGTVQEYNQIK